MKTILITGASGNLGKSVVEYLYEYGFEILATLASDHEIGLFDHLPEVTTNVIDLLNAESVMEFIEDSRSAEIQAAVLLVGGFAMGTLAETDATQLRKMYELNFLSAFNVVRPLMEQFTERGGGQFILIGARPALNPNDGKNMVAYALSKGLVFSLAELINAEGKANTITATVVVPSTIDTPGNRAAMPDADPDNWVPAKSIAKLIAFMLSDTGQMTRETVIKIYNKA